MAYLFIFPLLIFLISFFFFFSGLSELKAHFLLFHPPRLDFLFPPLAPFLSRIPPRPPMKTPPPPPHTLPLPFPVAEYRLPCCLFLPFPLPLPLPPTPPSSLPTWLEWERPEGGGLVGGGTNLSEYWHSRQH